MYHLKRSPISEVEEAFPLRGQGAVGSQSMPSEGTAKTVPGSCYPRQVAAC